ncbi:MAG: VOC family protein [Planctomycetota bacterium]
MNSNQKNETASAPAMGLIAFDHTTLIVDDVDASRQFYVKLLGMNEVARPDFDFAGAWFQLGQTMIHVTESGDKAGLAGWGDRKVKSISRGHHIAYTTLNFDDAVSAIAHYGIPIGDGPKTRPDGARQVYIYDPDGHLIEICEPTP